MAKQTALVNLDKEFPRPYPMASPPFVQVEVFETEPNFSPEVGRAKSNLNVVKVGIKETRQDTAMYKRVIMGGAVVTPSPRVDAPKQTKFGGKRDAVYQGLLSQSNPNDGATQEGKTWEMSKRCQTAFEGLKEVVMEEPILALPDHTKVFEVQTDASNFAIRGLLMQEGHPIAFKEPQVK
ncbi:hypothetical protein RJ639_007862 [Escallonia herrerae]|uniref:Reverse transcriptase/retrotransposon-derived protein RNase H-like domain-containing protein n=1 Tax=Escallonia herrerae TaxID=1293975 RepID=A0AA89AZG0_9ASTE|nr:hypothetical protein RJ639_007862 [Escallonia herrerae]